ncbi:MAG: prepilin-type N-terminal cleavage/methylation domain-containing protein, partial [Chitinispirillaceae bacterium]
RGDVMSRLLKCVMNQSGFTLIEIIVAAVIFTVTSLSLGFFMRTGTLVGTYTREIDIASRLAQDEAERVKAAVNAQLMLNDTTYQAVAGGREFYVERKQVTLDSYTDESSPGHSEALEYSIEIKKANLDSAMMEFRVLYK